MFGYTAKQTLDYAQSLYEKKLLTYPRTDSRYLTVDMTESASVVLHLAARVPPFDACPEFFPDVLALVNDKEVSDHHALIPTLELKKADVPALPVGERNILLLVCCVRRRSLSCMRRSRPPLIAVNIPLRQKESRCFPRVGGPFRRCSVPL